MRLLKDDEVVDVAVLSGNSNLLILTEKGNITYFNENEITDTGLKTSGVKGISTLKNSTVKALFAFRQDEKSKILLVTNNKMYRIYDNSCPYLTQRLGRTQVAFKSFKSDVHSLVYAQKIINKDEPVVLDCLMSDGTVLETSINEFYLTPVDKYCKTNMNIDSKAQIDKIYVKNVDVIDGNLKLEDKPDKPVPVENIDDQPIDLSNSFESPKEENSNKKETYEQISIFDDMGD